MSEILIKAEVRSEETLNNDEIHKANTQLKYEQEAEHERNILDMTQVDYYNSLWKDKDATTVNDLAYTFLNSCNDNERARVVQTQCTFCGGINHYAEKMFQKDMKGKGKSSCG